MLRRIINSYRTLAKQKILTEFPDIAAKVKAGRNDADE
jgi:hypothetical protein